MATWWNCASSYMLTRESKTDNIIGTKKMAKTTKSERVPKKMQAKFDEIVVFTDRVCKEYLDEEYAQLARQATAALCRKRSSPLAKGADSVHTGRPGKLTREQGLLDRGCQALSECRAPDS